MRTRRVPIVRAGDLLGVTAQIAKGDAELLVRAIARRNAIGQPMRSLSEWIVFHLKRDAAALDLVGEQDVRAQLARDLGLPTSKDSPRICGCGCGRTLPEAMKSHARFLSSSCRNRAARARSRELTAGGAP